MRAVVDTNVIVSALLKPAGPPGQVLNAILEHRIKLLYDDRILGEYIEVLSRPKFRITQLQVESIIGFIEQEGDYFSGQRLDIVLPDERDLPFLEVAVAGLADALITGNGRDFKPRKGSHNVRIMSPAEFLGR